MTTVNESSDTGTNIVWGKTVIFIGKAGWEKIVIFILLLVVLVFILWPGPKVKPDNTQQIIAAAQKVLEADFNKKIAAKEGEIRDWKSRYTVSEQKYKVITERYLALKKEKDDVKPPQTNDELRSRFTAMGFPPLPAK